MPTPNFPLRRAMWLFPIALTFHNLEEAFTLPRWSQTAGALHPPVGDVEFSFAVAVVTALGIVITREATRQGGRWLQAAAASWALMLLNVLFPHALGTTITGRYTPGVVTALVLNVPINGYLLRRALRERVVSTRQLIVATLVGIVLAALVLPVLLWLGRLLPHP